MSEYRRIGLQILAHTVFAAPFFWLSWHLLATAQGGWAAAGQLLFGMASLIVSGTILAWPIARLLAEPAGSLYYPGGQFDKPPPMYGIPEAKRNKGLYREALAEYARIAREYPDEVKPYEEMMDIAIVELRSPRHCDDIYRRGLAALRKEEDRKVLKARYVDIRSRYDSRTQRPLKVIRWPDEGESTRRRMGKREGRWD